MTFRTHDQLEYAEYNALFYKVHKTRFVVAITTNRSLSVMRKAVQYARLFLLINS